MINVKIIYMARKPKRNQEAYTRLSFLPKQKELRRLKGHSHHAFAGAHF